MTERPQPGTTITCQEVVDIITDYLEGAVDDAAREDIEAHLALCPGCEQYLAQMRSTLSALGHIPLDSLSDATKDNLLASFGDFLRPGR